MNLKNWNICKKVSLKSAFTRKLAIEFAESQCFLSCNCELCLHHGNTHRSSIKRSYSDNSISLNRWRHFPILSHTHKELFSPLIDEFK